MKKLLLILPLFFEALSEGLELRGVKFWGKQVEILELASWFLILFYFWQDKYNKRDFILLVVVYVLLRTIFFNYAHNIAAGLQLNYLGTVSIIDRIAALLGMGNWYIIGAVQVICAVAVWGIVKRNK